MRRQPAPLPSRFPVGTRYVIEGSGGRIRLRYLVFPDGRHVNLPADLAAQARTVSRARRPGSASRLKKISTKFSAGARNRDGGRGLS
jgi:hypothetical protein